MIHDSSQKIKTQQIALDNLLRQQKLLNVEIEAMKDE